jgi:hypothetical protein
LICSAGSPKPDWNAVFDIEHSTGNLTLYTPSMRITPSMAAGLSDHVWSLEEIVMMADSYMPQPGKRGPYKKRIQVA